MSSLCTINDEDGLSGAEVLIDDKNERLVVLDERSLNQRSIACSLNNVRFGETGEATVTNNQVNVQLVYPSDLTMQQLEVLQNMNMSNNNDMKIINIYPFPSNNMNITWGTTNYNFSANCPFSSYTPVFYNSTFCPSQSKLVTYNNFVPNGSYNFERMNMPQPIIMDSSPALIINNQTDTTAMENSNDEDVVFVKEYKVDVQDQIKNCNSETEENQQDVSNLKRKPVLPGRKNPTRKTQMDKASIKLAQNLSIPPSVFNARASRKRNNQRAVRQSNRITGAILNPPSPLKETDYKEWPAEGLHETSWYNEQTSTIEYASGGVSKKLGKRTKSKTVDVGRLSASSDCKPKRNHNKLGILAHHNLHLVLSYVADVKEYCTIPKHRDVSLEEKEDEKNILNDLTKLLYDTCDLYSLLNKTDISSMTTYIRSLSTH